MSISNTSTITTYYYVDIDYVNMRLSEFAGYNFDSGRPFHNEEVRAGKNRVKTCNKNCVTVK